MKQLKFFLMLGLILTTNIALSAEVVAQDKTLSATPPTQDKALLAVPPSQNKTIIATVPTQKETLPTAVPTQKSTKASQKTNILRPLFPTQKNNVQAISTGKSCRINKTQNPRCRQKCGSSIQTSIFIKIIAPQKPGDKKQIIVYKNGQKLDDKTAKLVLKQVQAEHSALEQRFAKIQKEMDQEFESIRKWFSGFSMPKITDRLIHHRSQFE